MMILTEEEEEISQLEKEIQELHHSLPLLLQSCNEESLFGPIAEALGLIIDEDSSFEKKEVTLNECAIEDNSCNEFDNALPLEYEDFFGRQPLEESAVLVKCANCSGTVLAAVFDEHLNMCLDPYPELYTMRKSIDSKKIGPSIEECAEKSQKQNGVNTSNGTINQPANGNVTVTVKKEKMVKKIVKKPEEKSRKRKKRTKEEKTGDQTTDEPAAKKRKTSTKKSKKKSDDKPIGKPPLQIQVPSSPILSPVVATPTTPLAQNVFNTPNTPSGSTTKKAVTPKRVTTPRTPQTQPVSATGAVNAPKPIPGTKSTQPNTPTTPNGKNPLKPPQKKPNSAQLVSPPTPTMISPNGQRYPAHTVAFFPQMATFPMHGGKYPANMHPAMAYGYPTGFMTPYPMSATSTGPPGVPGKATTPTSVPMPTNMPQMYNAFRIMPTGKPLVQKKAKVATPKVVTPGTLSTSATATPSTPQNPTTPTTPTTANNTANGANGSNGAKKAPVNSAAKKPTTPKTATMAQMVNNGTPTLLQPGTTTINGRLVPGHPSLMMQPNLVYNMFNRSPSTPIVSPNHPMYRTGTTPGTPTAVPFYPTVGMKPMYRGANAMYTNFVPGPMSPQTRMPTGYHPNLQVAPPVPAMTLQSNTAANSAVISNTTAVKKSK